MTSSPRPTPLSTDLLLQAYRIGYFPMAEDATSDEVFWVQPDWRGIIPLDGFHLSKSLRKAIRREPYRITIDQDFRGVMAGCALPQTHRESTWINEEIRSAYGTLFDDGHAHSVEAWQGEDLVGGLYGVDIGGAFFGESMFSTQTDASKICLAYLVARLRAGGYRLLDTQFQNDHLVQFGTVEVDQQAYKILLEQALEAEGDFSALPDQISGATIVQSITQTS